MGLLNELSKLLFGHSGWDRWVVIFDHGLADLVRLNRGYTSRRTGSSCLLDGILRLWMVFQIDRRLSGEKIVEHIILEVFGLLFRNFDFSPAIVGFHIAIFELVEKIKRVKVGVILFVVF